MKETRYEAETLLSVGFSDCYFLFVVFVFFFISLNLEVALLFRRFLIDWLIEGKTFHRKHWERKVDNSTNLLRNRTEVGLYVGDNIYCDACTHLLSKFCGAEHIAGPSVQLGDRGCHGEINDVTTDGDVRVWPHKDTSVQTRDTETEGETDIRREEETN